MKLAAGRIEAFLRRPDPVVRAVLVYGPDTGLVRERGTRLARSVLDDPSDPFRVADLPAAAVTSDPARVIDEAAALSLIGGRRLVRIRDAEERMLPAFANLFANLPAGDSLVVAEAGDLDKRSRLRALFESAPSGAAIPCYVEDEESLGRVIADLLNTHRLAIDPDAQAYLAANLVGDRLIVRSELEKLALYMGDARRVELADVQACIGDSTALSFDEPVWAAADGDFAGLDRALGRLFGDGTGPIPILRAAQRHFQRLHLVNAQVARGTSAETVVAGLRPPLFFKVKNQFMGQLRRWPLPALGQAMERLAEAEAECKRTNMPDETICARTLLQLAAMARAAGRR